MDPNHFLMWILLRFELFDYFNGSCSSKDQVFDFATKHLEGSPAAPNTRSDESQLNLQDEQLQWNRLTEEMLYLVIVIVGTARSSRLELATSRVQDDDWPVLCFQVSATCLVSATWQKKKWRWGRWSIFCALSPWLTVLLLRVFQKM